MTVTQEYFPRMESAQDGLGSIWTPERGNSVTTGIILRVGDHVDFVVTATDPLGGVLGYSLLTPHRPRVFQPSNTLSWDVPYDQIGKEVVVFLYIISDRDYHARDFCDDWVSFSYEILPAA